MKTHSILTLILFLTANFHLSQAQDVIEDQIEEEVSDQVALKLNFKINDRFRFISEKKSQITQQVVDNELQTNSESDIQLLFEVESYKDNVFKIKTTLERIAITLQLPEKTIQIDTDKTEDRSDSLHSKLYRSFINKPFYITINKEGEFLALNGLTNPESLDIKDNDLLTDFFFFEDIKEALHIFPNKLVSMGETWTNNSTSDLENRMGFNIKKNFTLESLSEDLAWINVNHEVTQKNEPSLEENSKIGSQEGTIELDRNSGIILYSEIQTELEGTFYNKSQDLKSPIKISSTKIFKGEKL